MDSNNIKVTPKWSKTKEQIWAERFEHLADKPKVVPLYRQQWFAYAAAAIIIVMLALPTTAFLYTTDIVVPRGEHLTAVLPDGSKVELNADSRLSYKPYWWRVEREVTMSGEGYFEVAKGSRFTISTSKGSVAVLGTSFNVLARENNFSVVCLTGKVEVVSGRASTTLTPDMQATLQGNKLTASTLENPEQSIGWTQGKFYFEAAPLQDVIREIERQYNIKVGTPDRLDYLYTGNFSRDKDPHEVLRIIGTPFGIELTVK